MPLIRKPPAFETMPPGGTASPSLRARALAGGSAEERWAAARAADGADDVPALGAALLREEDARVREAIFTALTRIGGAASVAAVVPLLRSHDARVRTGALDALRAMPAAMARGLPDLLADPDADVRLLACDLARVLPGGEAGRLLCALIDHEPEVNVCAAAVDVLAEAGGGDALPALERCARRFPDAPFLAFAIRVAAQRIGEQKDAIRE